MSATDVQTSPQDAIRKLRRLEAQNRRLRRARKALLGAQEASAAVASCLDPRQALQVIVDEAVKVVGGDTAAIFLLDTDQDRLEPQAVAGDVTPDVLAAVPSVPVRSRGWKTLCENGGLVVGDAVRSPHLVLARPYMRERGIKSLIVVPLMARGKAIGMIGVSHRRRKRAFGRDDLRIIRLFADQAAVALDNSNLYAQATDLSARIKTRLELEKAIFDGMNDPMAILDREDRIAFGNRALFRALGRRPSRVIGRPWDQFVEPEDAEALRAQVQAASGGVVSCQIRIRRPDGSRIPFAVSAGESHDSSGAHLGAVAVITNLERGGVGARLQDSQRMVASMGRLTRAGSRLFDINRLADHAVRSATGLLGLDHGVLYLTEGDELILTAAQGVSAEFMAEGARIKVKGSASSRAMATRRPLVFADIRRVRRINRKLRDCLPPAMRGGAVIPIPGRESPLGVLAVGGSDPAALTHEAVSMLTVITGQFGAAVENARLYQAAHRRAERLAALNHAAERLISCSDPAEVVTIICEGLASVLDAKRALCLDHDAKKGLLIPIGGHNIPASRLRRLPSMRLQDAPVLALSVSERQPVLCPDVGEHKAMPERYCAVLGTHAAVAVPVISRTELCGILVADNDGAPMAMSQDEKDMAMALANQSAVTLDNIFLLQEERARSQQLSLAVQEAHHRIKNNLQAVCDLLELELIQSGGADPADGIEHSVQRVRAISLVHEFLTRHHDVATVNVSQVLERLVPLVVVSNQGRDQEVGLAVEASPLTLNSKQTTALALIVHELVSNAVRHGLDDGRAGAVRVSLSDRNGTIELRVTDDGTGLPADFDMRTHGHVGLEIARVLAERDLGGTIVLRRRGGRAGGTVARVRFPR